MDRFYQARVDRVIDHIEAHIDESLSVATLAQIACFSEFHFNRLFKARTGESVYQFVRRLRLEKAAAHLICGKQSVTEIALSLGFANSASFAKSFKQYFQLSASEWKATQLLRAEGERFCSAALASPVQIENLPAHRVAYIRNIGSYIADAELFEALYRKLFAWAGPRNIPLSPSYNLYHDNRFITDQQKLRVMVALAVPLDIEPSGNVGLSQLSGGCYAVRQYHLKEDEFSEAWDWMSQHWLPDSGYQIDSQRESIERCLGETQHLDSTFYQVDICVPVMPA